MDTSSIVTLLSGVKDKANLFIIRELKKHHLGKLAPSHGSILAALFFVEHLSMTEIVNLVHKDKSTATVLIDKLERLGYVERRRHPDSGRYKLVRLTPRGRELKPVVYEISRELLKRIYRNFAEDEKEVLIRLLNKMRDNL